MLRIQQVTICRIEQRDKKPRSDEEIVREAKAEARAQNAHDNEFVHVVHLKNGVPVMAEHAKPRWDAEADVRWQNKEDPDGEWSYCVMTSAQWARAKAKL